MKEQTAKETFFEYVKDPKTWFYWYHNPERIYLINKKYKEEEEEEEKWTPKWRDKNFHRLRGDMVIYNHDDQKDDDIVIHQHLNAFFEATLDEVRLKEANDFSEYALWISGNRPLAYFREAASKREVAADIDYNMQRDHAVHTLYNYILGWYFFDNSITLRKAFWRYLNENFKYAHTVIGTDEQKFYKEYRYFCIKDDNKFMGPANQDNEFNSINLANEFGDVWSITSLLHDIGYILEGTISSASTEVENVRVNRGSKVVHDYFNHWFWEKFKVDFRSAQNIAYLLDISIPDFRYSQSLASLGDHLCDIGSCENIRRELLKREEFRNIKEDLIIDKEKCNRLAPPISLTPTPA